nr:hypothetical protein [Tanacetum cinerariifolium]
MIQPESEGPTHGHFIVRLKVLKSDLEMNEKRNNVDKRHELTLEQSQQGVSNDVLDNSVSNQSTSSFDQYFELNELKAQLQEKDKVISKLKERIKSLSALRDELRNLKGKAIVDTTVTTHTIHQEMLKVDVKPIAPRLLNNRTVHSDYLRLTQEQATIVREVVEQEKS